MRHEHSHSISLFLLTWLNLGLTWLFTGTIDDLMYELSLSVSVTLGFSLVWIHGLMQEYGSGLREWLIWLVELLYAMTGTCVAGLLSGWFSAWTNWQASDITLLSYLFITVLITVILTLRKQVSDSGETVSGLGYTIEALNKKNKR